MVVAQKVKEAEITEQDSLLLTRNLLRIAIFNISYIRGLFPEKYFNDKSVPALEMKIKKLMPVDAESRRLIDWMEKGVYDALQKKYLKTLLFCICETIEGPMIEEYAFSFSYPDGDSQEISMDINRSGNKKQGGTFKCNSMNEVTPSRMKSSACKMIRTLVQLMRTLDKMPEERTILMKLLYYDDVTPADYEPPFFKGCTDDSSSHWTKKPLKMEVGNVNSKHLILALKVKSVLDPCEDEDEDEENQDESANLAADSDEKGGSPTSSSEMNSSQEDQYLGSPEDKPQPNQDDTDVSQGIDETQNPAEDEHQLRRVKDWINCGKFETVEMIDAMAKFPDISTVLIEGKALRFIPPHYIVDKEIMGKLVGEGLLSKCGIETYVVNKPKNFEYEFDVKEETDERSPQNGDKVVPASGEDYLYTKALYHALPQEYVTISKLQSKLEGQANQTTVKKLIDKMTREGFLEATSNRKLGKRVVHSELTERKLNEVKKALDFESMDVDVNGTQQRNKLIPSESDKSGSKRADISTCGVLRSIGSDLTRMRLRSESEILQNGSTRTDESLSRTRETPNTPMSKAGGPVPSRESTMLGNGKSRSNGHSLNCNEVDDVICSRVSHDKRSRKESTVEDPIIQYYKRQKSEAVA